MFRLVVLLNLIAHCLSYGPGDLKNHLDNAGDTVSVTYLDDGNPKYHVEKIAETSSGAEAPHWDVDQQALFFLEPVGKAKKLHKYVPATKKYTKTGLDALEGLGFVTPVEGTTDQFIVAKDLKFLVVQWDGEEGSEVEVLKTLAVVDSGSRINDGKADPRGRVFAGTLGDLPHGSALFRLDGSKISKLEDGITTGNGLVWDENENAFYYIDSAEVLKIRRYDYDIETGSISNKTYVFDGEGNEKGILDGLTIDTNGNLLAANYHGRAILHINPKTGKLLQRIYLPGPVFFGTSIAFGGPNLDILYVTTAKPPSAEHISQSQEDNNAGATFAITGLGIQGRPMSNFKYDTDTTYYY